MEYVSYVCRTCEGFDNLTPLFKNNENEYLLTHLMSCANIQVCEDDGLPQQICQICIKQLESAFEFKKRCEDLDFKFRELFDNVKEEIPEPLCTLLIPDTDIKPEVIYADHSCDIFNDELENKIDENEEKMFINNLLSLKQESAKTKKANVVPVRKRRVPKLFICPGCDLTFTDYVQFIEHKQTHGKKKYLCKICNRGFQFGARLKDHQRVHKRIEELKFYECEICLNKFSNIGNLRRHMRIHNDDRRYECDICKKNFVQSNTLREHKLTHTDQRNYSCPECNKAFKIQKYLEKHIELVHNNLGSSFPCQLCTRTFRTERNLLWHLKRHGENKVSNEKLKNRKTKTGKVKQHKQQTFPCRFCEKTFKYIRFLKMHERVHTGEKPYLCRYCGKTYSQRALVISHERIVHNKTIGSLKVDDAEKQKKNNEKLHDCKTCGKSFATSIRLRDHINVHTGERPYVCGICNQGFKQRGHLRQHSLGHTGAKPHICTHCGKGFRLKGNLHTHVRIHTGERPYTCKICALRFIDLNGLKKHAKKHDT